MKPAVFKQIFDEKSCTYTYILASGMGREAIIIDPVKEQVPQYCDFLNKMKIRLAVAIDTHLHADHITGTGDLANKERCIIMMGKQTKAECVDAFFSDNEYYCFDGINLQAKYTPGHTEDSYCYYVNQRMIFTGDTLLINGTGRTDFQGGSAAQQYQSLKYSILTLPSNTIVYPAHDYNGETSSTIVKEQRENPRLQVQSESEYVELMNTLSLSKPKLMDIAIPANLQCGKGDYS